MKLYLVPSRPTPNKACSPTVKRLAWLQFPYLRRTLFIMRVLHCRPQSFLISLRWVLAVLLILNSAVAPRVMAHAAMTADHAVTAQTMPIHCHHHDASTSSEQTKHHNNECPCCVGDGCQCGCVVSSAPPITFPELRRFAPQALVDYLRASAPAAAPRHRLLRPPSFNASLAA